MMTTRPRGDDRAGRDRLGELADRLLGDGRLRRSAGYVAWSAAGLTALLVATMAVPALEARRANRPSTVPASVRIVDAPEWLVRTPELMEELGHRIADAAGSVSNDRDGLVRAHAQAESSGWFERVERIQRLPDGTIRLEGSMVTPFAVIRWGEKDHLVDADGRLLDWAFAPGSAGSQLPLLVGTRTPPPTHQDGRRHFGAEWSHAEEISAGLELARRIRDRAWSGEVRAIEVGGYPDLRCLWIQCEGGPRICWGLAPNVRSAAEITPDEKLRLIDSIHELYGPMSRITVSEIDVRHDVATTRALTDATALSSP